jgi:hypothetical protein
MPREQRTKLQQGPVTEVTPGTFESGVVKTVAFDAIEPVKSSAQKLAETLEVGVKAVGRIVQNKQKEQDTQDMIEWNQYGTTRGLQEADRLSQIEDKNERIREADTSFHTYMESLKGHDLSQASLKAAASSFGRYVVNNQETALKAKLEEEQQLATSKLQTTVDIELDKGASLSSVFKIMDESGVFRGDKKARSEQFIDWLTLNTNKKMLNNPAHSPEDAIKLLQSSTPDGQLSLDTTEAGQNAILTLRRLASSNTIQNNENVFQSHADIIRAKNITNPEAYLKGLENLSSGQTERLTTLINRNLSDNQKEAVDGFVNRITNEIIESEKMGGISLQQRLTLQNRIETFKGGEKVRVVKAKLAGGILNSNFDAQTINDFKSATNQDGSAKYTVAHIKSAITDSVQRTMPGVMSQFMTLESDAKSNNWTDIEKTTKAKSLLDQFGRMVEMSTTEGVAIPQLNTFFRTAAYNLEGKPKDSQLSLLDDFNTFAIKARNKGLYSKDINDFTSNIAAMRVLIKINPEGVGIEKYNAMKESGELGFIKPQSPIDIIGAQTDLAAEPGDDDMRIALESEVGFDVYNTVYAYTKSHDLAKEAMNDQLKDSYYKLDLQANEGLFADAITAVTYDDQYYLPKNLFGDLDENTAQEHLDATMTWFAKEYGLGSDVVLYPVQGGQKWMLKGDDRMQAISTINLKKLLSGKFKDVTFIETFKKK